MPKLVNSKAGGHVTFTEEGLPSGDSTIKAWLVECCSAGCPSGRITDVHRGTLELCQWPSCSWSPPWSRPLSSDCSVYPAASSRKSLGGSRLLTFNNDGGHCVPGPSTLQKFFGTLSQICSSTQSCLRALQTIPLTSLAWFLLWHALSTVAPYIDRCLPFQIMSNQFNLPQVDSHQVVETSLINGNRMHLSKKCCIIAKGLHTYVSKIQCLAKVFGPLELCDLLPHFRLQTLR